MLIYDKADELSQGYLYLVDVDSITIYAYFV